MSGVLVLAGPTASGKTELAVALAREFGAEIVGADSRQIYRGMTIGTGAPAPAQLAAVPHHLVAFLDPARAYSAAQFCADAVAAIRKIHGRGKRAIVAGGTGFYIRALTGSVALSRAYDEALRDRLAAEARLHGDAFLHGWLACRDPARAAALHPRDRYRVLRALEIALAPMGARYDDVKHTTLAREGVSFMKVFLDVDPSTLDARIERRAGAMLRDGLIDEAERIGDGAVASNAVGFPQARAYLHGLCTRRELRALLIRGTKRYARRQEAWFRSEPLVHRLAASAVACAAREKLGWD